jgi:hypothetical protein
MTVSFKKQGHDPIFAKLGCFLIKKHHFSWPNFLAKIF